MTLYKSVTGRRDGNSTIFYVMLRDGGFFSSTFFSKHLISSLGTIYFGWVEFPKNVESLVDQFLGVKCNDGRLCLRDPVSPRKYIIMVLDIVQLTSFFFSCFWWE